jgi:dTDP-4-dehydrorhamnose 3,5-epimerase-like enzyme
LNSKFEPTNEYEINFFDKELDIRYKDSLKSVKPTLSEKDRNAPTLFEQQKENLLPTL